MEDNSINNSQNKNDKFPQVDEEHRLLKKNVILIFVILVVVIGALLFAYLHGHTLVKNL